ARVAGAGGHDDSSRRDLAAVLENDGVEARLDLQPGYLTRSIQASAEPHCLDGRPPGEITARDAIWEPCVVLDARARSRLSTDRDSIQGDRAQTLRRAVDRGGEPGGAAADDHQIKQISRRGVEGQPEVLGEGGR